MKTNRNLLLCLFILFVANIALSQNIIKSDTTINKRIKKKETFTLDFKSCHTCGYKWILDKNTDTTRLVFINVTQAKNTEHQVGGNETESWSFQGKKKGKYQLVFIYKITWLEAIEKKVKVNIKVK